MGETFDSKMQSLVESEMGLMESHHRCRSMKVGSFGNLGFQAVKDV